MKVNKSNPNWMHGFPPIRMTQESDGLHTKLSKEKLADKSVVYTVPDTIKRNNQLATIMSILL
ncbi:hypothetical protein GNVKYODX_CDS83 [Acinetobacter phage vB_AbaM_AB3P2]|nr:hypothetical protein GNVKYODX_CDS83 [Acinetobacter phage vB_AbaM_AB3P2]